MNVYHHSGSRIAHIKLEKDANRVILRVIDHGRGILTASQAVLSDSIETIGVGIPGMRQRLEQLGGKLEIESTNLGTTITAIVPLSEK
jgi:signal transduction histidine kinase